MSGRILLDTNAVSSLIRGPSALLLQRLAGHTVCISVITEAELRFGVARKPGAHRLAHLVEELIARLDVLPWVSATARRYALLRAEMEARGVSLSSLDLLIAAHALAEACPLVTADRAFLQVPNLEVLPLTPNP